MFTLPNEPQGIGRILDNGFRLFKTGLSGALGIMLIMIGSGIVLGIILSLVLGVAGAQFINSAGMEQMPHFGLGALLLILVSMVVYGLFFTYFTSAVILYYANIGYKGSANLGEALSGAFSRLMPAFGALILMTLFLIILYVPAFIHQTANLQSLASGQASPLSYFLIQFILQIPYLYFSITLGFTIYRAVIDNYGPLAAPIGSQKLMWGKFWRTTLWLIIVYVIIGIVFLAVFYPLFGEAISSPEALSSISTSTMIIGIVALFVLMLFVLPFIVAMTIPYYHDLKLRKEGGDLASRVIAA